MKYILTTIVLLLFVGCSSTPDEISTAMKPFMSQNFPKATYDVIAEEHLYQLVINDQGDAVSKDNVEPKMTETLGQFFSSFYNTSNTESVDSKLMIVYKSKTFTWNSKMYDFTELGKMFSFKYKE